MERKSKNPLFPEQLHSGVPSKEGTWTHCLDDSKTGDGQKEITKKWENKILLSSCKLKQTTTCFCLSSDLLSLQTPALRKHSLHPWAAICVGIRAPGAHCLPPRYGPSIICFPVSPFGQHRSLAHTGRGLDTVGPALSDLSASESTAFKPTARCLVNPWWTATSRARTDFSRRA